MKGATVCSYCGCEAEPVISSLMDDHAAIATRVRRITEHLDANRMDYAWEASLELAQTFGRHAETEEEGLFTQLRLAGAAVEEVDLLVGDHRRIVSALCTMGPGEPDQLRAVLDDLLRHAAIEDNDLFPFAMQRLPNESWGSVEHVHQAMLTR